ncbi:hypothetical protein NUACC21_31440 [Scytonema sp. NUACC21]
MPLILGNRFLPLRLLVPHEYQGGFGKTFLAQDLNFPHRPLRVIKQLYPQIPPGRLNLTPSELEHIQELFKREARILSEFRHSQIPRAWAYFVAEVPPDLRYLSVYETGHRQSFFYLVQDYIEGQNLAQELRQDGRFSGRDVINLLQQILPVLDYIHNFRTKDFEGVLHRDIKPSNIMRSHHNNSDGKNLYLIDFGAVKQVVVKGIPVDSSCVLGTPTFASPEQIAGREISAASDLYSLAATCVCLLTGEEPSELRSGDSWNWKPYANVNENLARILDKMLSCKQEERYQSAREVLEALSAISASRFPDPVAPFTNPSSTPPIPPKPLLTPQLANTIAPHFLERLRRRYIQCLRQMPRLPYWISLGFLALLAVAITVILHPLIKDRQPSSTSNPKQVPTSENERSLTAEYFSRGENALIADAQEFSTIPECQKAYDFKKQGMEAFAKATSAIAFKKAEESFKEAINQFRKVPVRNMCKVDPETWIYYYNSKIAQTTSGSAIPTIAVVIPGSSESVRSAQEILRGIAQVQHEQNQTQGRPILQILIVKENTNTENINTKNTKIISEIQQVAEQISENKIPGELQYFSGSNILGVIGRHTSKYIWEVGDIYGKHRLVLISPTSTAIRTPNPYSNRPNLNPYVFRTASNDSIAAGDLADYMWDGLRKRKVLIAFESGEPYSESLKGEFEKNLINDKEANNQNILDCDLKRYDPKTCVSKARNENVEALMLFPSSTTLEAALEIARLNSQSGNSKLPILAGDVLYDKKTLDDLGDAAKDMVVAVPFHVSLSNTNFQKKALELWGTKNVSWRTLTAYDAAQALVAALTELAQQGNSNPSPQDVYEILKAQTFSAPSATAAKVEFDDEHDREIVKNVGVLVRVNVNQNTGDSSKDEYGFTLQEIPRRKN